MAEDESELGMTLQEVEEMRGEMFRAVCIGAGQENRKRREVEMRLEEVERELARAKEEARIAKSCYEKERDKRGEKILAAQVREERKRRAKAEVKGGAEGRSIEKWGGL